MQEFTDETGDYKGLDSPPHDGEDQIRVNFSPSHAADGWDEYRRTHCYAERNRHPLSDYKLQNNNYPWKTPEGDCTWSLKEMQNICNEIHAGTHPFHAINQKETLRCINEANIMFRDTMRDLDEGEACSEASEPPREASKIQEEEGTGRARKARSGSHIGPSQNLGHRGQPGYG